MRKLGIAVGVIVVLIVLALLIVPRFVDVNQYRGQIQAQLQKRLNRPVTLGDMHLSLLPPSVQVNGFTIGEDPAFGNGNFAKAQRLYVSAKFLPLLHGNVEISSLDLRQPDIELIRNAQGTWNFSTIGPQTTAKQPSGTSEFALDNLKITDGTVAVTDKQQHQPRSVYDHIDLKLNNYAPQKPFSFKATARLPGRGSQMVQLKGNAGPIDKNDTLKTPFSGTLNLDQVDIAGVQKYLNSPSLAGMEGVVSGTTDINNDQGKVSSRGSLEIKDARVRGVNIGYPISADYRVTDDLNASLIKIDKGDLKLGSTPLSITGTLNAKPTPSEIDLRLQASNISIAEAARLAGAFGVAFNPGTNVAGQATADIHATGPTSQPALNGTLNARNLVVSGGDLPEQVKVQSIDFALTPQQIKSNPFTAVAGSTTLNGQFTLARYTTPQPTIDAILRTSNAQISELLSIAKAYGISAASGMSGSGTLSLDVHAVGPLKNTNAMMFNGNGALRNASLKSPSLTQPLNVRMADIQFNSNAATLNNLNASLGSTNATGNMTVRNFAAPAIQFTLNADKVNVAELQQITSAANARQQRAAVEAPRPTGPENRQPANSSSTTAGLMTVAPRAHAQPARVPPPAPAQSNILAKMTGNGTVSVGTVQYDQLIINNVRSNVTMSRGIVTLSPITAQLYGGQETGQITANLLTTPMLVTVNSKMGNVRANDLISSVSSLKQTIYGLLAANTNLRFAAASSADIARTLSGQLNLNLTNGRIAKIDLLNQLALIGKFVGLRQSGQAMTNFARLTGTFNVENGVAQTNNLQAVIDHGTLAAAGIVNLATQEMNLHLTAVLDKNATQQAGGTSIGGLMQTALQNNRGELVMPVLVTGTFDNPHFAPDVQKVAQMRLQNLLPTLNNPAAGGVGGIVGSILGGKGGQTGQQGGAGNAVGDILGALAGQQQGGQQQQNNPQQNQQQQQNQAQQQQQNQPANAVGDLLNNILGGKKKQQQQQPEQPPK